MATLYGLQDFGGVTDAVGAQSIVPENRSRSKKKKTRASSCRIATSHGIVR